MEFSLRHTMCFKENSITVLFSVVIFLILPNFLSYADEKTVNIDSDNSYNKIHITSDRLLLNRNDEYFEFSGNVSATRGETVITSDSLKLYYSKGINSKQKSGNQEGTIKKIYAAGNVQIIMDDKIASAQQAVYTSENKVLVLSGGESKLISGDDSVTAEKITLYREDGHIVIEGGKKKRVEAILSPEKKINIR